MALGSSNNNLFSRRSAMSSRAGAKGRAYRTAQSMGMRNGANSHYLSSASQSYSRSRRSRGGDYTRGRMRSSTYGRANMMFGNKGGILGYLSGILANWRSWAPIAGMVAAVVILFLIISSGLRACAPVPEPTATPTPW